MAVEVGRNNLLYRSLLQLSQRSRQLKTLCCLTRRLRKGCIVLSIMLSSLCNILLSTTDSRGSRAVPSTEPAFFISLFNLLESLALMLLPQQMAANKLHLQQQTGQRFNILLNILLHTLTGLRVRPVPSCGQLQCTQMSF